MARLLDRLNAIQVSKRMKPGYHLDGAGLYLAVGASGSKSWIFRYRYQGREHEMGLGSINALTLAEAREMARQQRKLLALGKSPLEQRAAEKIAKRLSDANIITFTKAAESYIKANRAGWRNEKHAEQWQNTLQTYAEPVIGELPVAKIQTAHILRVLQPVWTTKNETASRLRGRIEKILDWCKVQGYRTGENPAAWKGHLSEVLPSPRKVQEKLGTGHHAALPWVEMSQFMQALRQMPGCGSLAVQFIILTACRTSEALNAKWEEIDLNAALWIIPKERMKAFREHRVPLSEPVLGILKQIKAESKSTFVFPGRDEKKPLSNMVGLQLLKRLGRSDLTIHGFRSTFKDWVREVTHYPDTVSEAALAHVIGDKTIEAYARGDLFEKRRALMADWALHCSTVKQSTEVIAIHAKNSFNTF